MGNVALKDLDLVNPDLLPPIIRRCVRRIGLPETIKLLEARGGLPTRMPYDYRQCIVLKGVLTVESLIALAKEFKGQRIDLPKPDKILTQLRNIGIFAARQHMSAAQVAREFGLTRRHVFNLPSPKKSDPTGDLFDE
jgi:hypothetical protein